MGLGFGYTFGPLARDLLEEFGWTRAMYSSARAPQLFVIAFASPLLGWLTVRQGARRILLLSTLVLGLTFAGLGRMQSLWQLTALVMLYGVSVTGVGDITVGQSVAQWVTRHRGLALGFVYTGSNLGGALFTRMAADVADAASWRAAFLALGGVALFVMLPVAFVTVRDRRAPASADGARHPAQELGSDTDLDLRAALRTRSFWILLFSLFTFFFYFLTLLEHLVLFLTDAGMPRDEAAAWFSWSIALGMVSKIALGLLADRVPYRSALILDYALLAASSCLLLALPHSTLLWIFVAAYGFSTAARDVVYPLIVMHCFGVRYMAEIYGALMLALLPGGALGPIFAGAVHDQTGSYQLAFAVFAALNAVAVLSLLFVRREPRPG
jgi:MFS family permease